MTKGEVKTAKQPNLGKLEEDDEFEDFPVEEWSKEQTDSADLQVSCCEVDHSHADFVSIPILRRSRSK